MTNVESITNNEARTITKALFLVPISLLVPTLCVGTFFPSTLCVELSDVER